MIGRPSHDQPPSRTRAPTRGALAQEQAEQGPRRLKLAGGAVALVAIAVVVVVVLSTGHEKPRSPARNPALLASTARQATRRPINGIQRQTTEQVLFHIHAHLTGPCRLALRLRPLGRKIKTNAKPLALSLLAIQIARWVRRRRDARQAA